MRHRPFLALAIGLLWATPVLASPVATCILDTESAYPNATYLLLHGTDPVLTTPDLGTFLQAVADQHARPDLGIGANPVGRVALEQALNCLWDAGAWTLSAAAIQVRRPDLTVSGFVGPDPDAEVAQFIGLRETCDGIPALEYRKGNEEQLWLTEPEGAADRRALFYGVDEFEWGIWRGCEGTCSDVCFSECTPSGGTDCTCYGSGTCHLHIEYNPPCPWCPTEPHWPHG